MTTVLAPLPKERFTDATGAPLIGGKFFVYAAGSTTKQVSYTDSTGGTPNTNPVILDARGEANVWLDPTLAYKFVLAPSTDTDPPTAAIWTVDNVTSATSALAAATGAGLMGYGGQLNYAVGTIGWAVNLLGGMMPEWFGAVGDGVTDDTTAVRNAAAAAAVLAGPQYTDTMGQAPYGYGTSRRLKLSGKKYAISGTITLAGNIGIYADGGGFLALAAFPAGSYMVDTGANPYCGRVGNLVLDGAGRNVKGANIQNAFMTRWPGLSVINCANDSVVVQNAGPEFYLTDFDIAGCITPVSAAVAGLRVLGSDSNFCNGTIKYTPNGVWLANGGNNNITNVHCWGTYTGYRMYNPFVEVNSSRNNFTGCYADSPSKQDWTQPVNATVNGVPNGGACFQTDVNSTQHQIIGGRGFISTTLWAAFAAPWSGATPYTAQQIVTNGGTTYCCILANTNQAPPNATYWTAIPANQFYLGYIAGQFNQQVAVPYNYAGNWAGDWLFSSNAVRDTCLVFGSPNSPAGGYLATNNTLKTLAGSSLFTTINNDDSSANASSGAFLQWVVGANTILQVGGQFGAAGASSAYFNVLGSTRLQWSGTQALFSNAGASEGAISYQFNDGVGSYPPMTLHRTGGASAPNAANASAKFGMTLVTSRSINAAGTINASGADYAEYEDNNGLVFAKGDLVGFKSNGTLTRTFVEAIRCGVKSTNPSYVGGDVWGSPEVLGSSPPNPPPQPLPLDDEPTDEEIAAQAVLWAEYDAALPAYEVAVAAFEATLEAARVKVDRVAYSGKVPCNVLNATPGQYIVAAPAADGSIIGMAVSNPTFDQYRMAVGRVNRILPDGRAEIAVMVH